MCEKVIYNNGDAKKTREAPKVARGRIFCPLLGFALSPDTRTTSLEQGSALRPVEAAQAMAKDAKSCSNAHMLTTIQ